MPVGHYFALALCCCWGVCMYVHVRLSTETPKLLEIRFGAGGGGGSHVAWCATPRRSALQPCREASLSRLFLCPCVGCMPACLPAYPPTLSPTQAGDRRDKRLEKHMLSSVDRVQEVFRGWPFAPASRLGWPVGCLRRADSSRSFPDERRGGGIVRG